LQFVVSLELPADHTAAARARRFVGLTLREWTFDRFVADAELLVSELVTNAILHARSSTRVTVERKSSSSVRVAVFDASPAPPRLRDYGPTAVTGRGLLLVDRISGSWGVERVGPGKCVWFEITDESDEDLPQASGNGR
jgi:anti-sigma regulatory factor (Ser/Thr protein kinase)